MANGVVVCDCGRIHWNNARAIRELYGLLLHGHIKTKKGYLRYKREAEGRIVPALAEKRFSTLFNLGLAARKGDEWYPVKPRAPR